MHTHTCRLALLLAAAAIGHTHGSSAPVRKIYAAGSGHDMFGLSDTTAEVVALSGKAEPRVLYLGTATYDDVSAQEGQTGNFESLGSTVTALQVAWKSPSKQEIEEAIDAADIIIVSGGNTLFAYNRWVKLGIDVLLKKAAERGVVLAGGSAGGIVWFDGGHSDSMDPTTYKNPPGPYFRSNLTKDELDHAWAYIRVPGLGVLPGLFCPHYDVMEGNGVLRATSFTNTLQHHSGETGIAVDNWGALMIHGDTYRVISRKGKTGSVSTTGQFTTNFTEGRPGAWTMTIDGSSGDLRRSLVPSEGRVADLFKQARYIAPSHMLEVAARQNPDDGLPPSSANASRSYVV